MYEKVDDFKYLSATLSMNNYWSKEIDIRISKTEEAFFALAKFPSRKTKVKLYILI